MASKLARCCIFIALFALASAAHALLPIQNWETSKGARVFFVENHDLPMLDVSVDFPAGSAFDVRDKAGTASMTNNLLRLGSAGMDEDAIARRTADIGAGLGGRFETDRAGLGLRTLSSAKERTEALRIFVLVVSQPTFPEAVLEREKVRLIAGLKEADTKPETIVSRTFARLIYPQHPYGLRSTGEIDTISKLRREDLVEFHRTHYNARNAVVAIMGDVTREEATAIAESITAELPVSDAVVPTLPEAEPLKEAVVRWIPHRSTQAHILIGQPGIRRNDPDYFPIFVGNYILGGGGFQSRITDQVRSKRGLAYSAYSYFSPMLREGPFIVGMQTKAEQSKDALEVVRQTLADYVANGPTPKELAAAKKNLIGGFPMRIDSNRKIHEYLTVIGYYRLPLTYLDDFVKRIDSVTIEQVKAAFQRHVHLDRMVTVVVGPVDEKAASAR